MALNPGSSPDIGADAGNACQSRRALWRQRGRRIATGLHVTLSLALAAVLTVMVNYAAYRYLVVRRDISSMQYYTLCERTRNLLGEMNARVYVGSVWKTDNPIGDEVRRLLDEYRFAAGQLDGLEMTVEHLDPDRDLARTRTLAESFDLPGANVVVLAVDGRHTVLTEDDFIEYDRLIQQSPSSEGRVLRVERKKRAFRGEQAISSALHSLVLSRRPLVYFVEGHGERNIDEFSSPAGYATIARQLRRDNIEVRKILLPADGVPADADAVVLAGPDRRLADPEIQVLADYLDRNGRMLVMVDPATVTGVDGLLESWNVRLARDVVVGLSLTGRELFIREYGDHPITQPLKGVVTMFYMPRSVEGAPDARGADAADRPHVSTLAYTTDGWAEFDLAQTPPRFDADSDRGPPVAVAVAVERGPPAVIDMELRPTRLVVIGDSDFVSNGALKNAVGGNVDFFLNAVNWLVERQELLAIAPKAPLDLTLDMDERQARVAAALIVGLLPSIAAIFGLLVWFARRR